MVAAARHGTMAKIAPSDGTPVKAEPTADEPVIGWRMKLMHKLDIYGE